jgi:hypothetical protein
VTAEDIDDDLGEPDRALRSVGLWRTKEGWFSGGFYERRPDVEAFAWPIDVVGLEAGEFSPSQSGVSSDGREGSVPVWERGGELIDLGGIKDPHVAATSFGELEAVSGRIHDASIPNRLVEGEFDPSHGSGHGLGGVSSCSEFRHQPASLFVGKPCQGDVANPRCDAFVAEDVGLDCTRAEMRPVGDDL